MFLLLNFFLSLPIAPSWTRRALGPHVDVVVLNVSCPNVKWTAGLGKDAISDIVMAVKSERDEMHAEGKFGPGRPGDRAPPLLLKLSPDMSAVSEPNYLRAGWPEHVHFSLLT